MYFVMGVTFQVVYLIAKKNIWQNIITHLLYNGAITGLGILGILLQSFIK
ncbi:hypothetical protein [Liquorilactobacillus sicerae]|nr:hypothetical protein [Liquorilactobacillus sicerae]